MEREMKRWLSRGCTSSPRAGSRSGSTSSRASSSTAASSQRMIERGRRHRADLEPVDLPEGDRRRRRLRRADRASCSSETDDPTEIFFALAIDDVRDAVRRAAARLGARPSGRTATSRSRSTRRSRTTPTGRSSRRSTCTTRSAGRTSTSRSRRRVAGPAGDRGLHRARRLDQHHADLLARALPARRRGLPARARAAVSSTAATRRRSRSVASFFVSRLDTEADARLEELGNAGAAGQARDREREARLQALPGGASRGRAGSALADAGALVQRPLWASTSTKNPAYRDVMYVEELIGPDTVNTMPPETSRRSRTTARCAATRCSRASTRRSGCSTSSREAGVDYDDVVETLEVEGRAEVRRRVRRADRRASRRKRGELARHVTTERARARRADLVARPDRLDGQGRGPLARLARRAVAHARGRRPAARRSPTTSRADRRRRAARHGRLVARARGAAARLRRRALPRARHDAPRRDPRGCRRAARPRAHALRLGVEVGLDARDALAHRLLLEARAARRAVGRDHRSRLGARGARARARVRARSSPGEPTIGGRYSALSPFGLVPAALARRRPRAAARPRVRDGRRVPPRRGQPGPRARPRARRGLARRAATRCACPNADGFGLWVEQLARRVDRARRARGSCPRRASRPTGPTGRRRRSGCPSPYELGQEFFRWEFAHRGRRLDPRHQPVRPAGRAGGEGQDERGARGAATSSSSPRASVDELLRAARATRDYVCIQAFVDPTAGGRRARIARLAARARERDRLRRHARLRAALPALDGPAPQGRPEHRRLPPGGRGLRRRSCRSRAAVRLRRG